MWGSCSRRGLAQVLHRFMQFYNFERPHHGYRVKGRTPATIFHGAVAVARWAHAPLWGGKSVNTNPNLDNLDGDLTLVPLPSIAGERRAEIQGRVKPTASRTIRRPSAYKWLRGLDLNQRPLILRKEPFEQPATQLPMPAREGAGRPRAP